MNRQRIAFLGIRLVHESLYQRFRDADRTLRQAGLRPGMRVLEVGCGPGFFTVPAARLVGRTGSVCAIDLNPFAVDHVCRKSERAGMPHVRVFECDASDTGFESASFDLAFLFGLRRAIGGMDRILTEMHRLLRCDGLLATEGLSIGDSSDLFEQQASRGRIFVYEKSRSGYESSDAMSSTRNCEDASTLIHGP